MNYGSLKEKLDVEELKVLAQEIATKFKSSRVVPFSLEDQELVATLALVNRDALLARPHYVMKVSIAGATIGGVVGKLVLQNQTNNGQVQGSTLRTEQIYSNIPRVGLATLMYLTLSSFFNKPFKPSGNRSEEGKALWSKLRQIFEQ